MTGADDHQKFLFERELDQAYLLLDHISLNSDKQIPPFPCAANDPAGSDLVARIAQIKYPPTGGAGEQAEQAHTLLLALDALNRAARPANGMTIAFTILVSGEGNAGKGSKPDASGRLDMARSAFPTLEKPAKWFAGFNRIFIFALTLFFALTCLLSWNVATGNALLARYNSAVALNDDIDKQIAAVQSTSTRVATTNGAASTQADPRTAAVPSTYGDYCDDEVIRLAKSGAAALRADDRPKEPRKTQSLDAASGLPLCVRRNDVNLQLYSARNNLRQWVHAFPWSVLAPKQDSRPSLPPLCDSAPVPMAECDKDDEVDAQWAAALLNVLAGAVLPIFFGLLGANAAVIRGVSARLRASVLGPRDLMLSLVQLLLGAIIGGCIGIFITPTGTDAKGVPGLLGSAQLSASALCFIAGFGVEGVFVALESLVRRVFDVDDPTARPAPKPS